MESLEQIINWIFGGQVDVSKIIVILTSIYAVIKSITEWAAKKKLLLAETAESKTQKDLKNAKEEIAQLKQCISSLGDVVLTAYLSSNTIPTEVKQKIGHYGEQLQKAADLELTSSTEKLIELATEVIPQANLNEKKEEILAATEIAEEAVDAANDIAQDAIKKIKLS